ncbi:hypothetical protein [Mucilaginibacter pedocola]|uniref:hypothetical protein n=1 Tax=Mucilaginibacter pedocola TaxID=1792845 RepID=UPI00117F2B5B|nr:hypothetical protein [Mucilaginibacter pedocola]
MDEEELYWLSKVQEAYDLVPMHAYMANVKYDPFKEIASNRFMIDDVYIAQDLIQDASEKLLTTCLNSEGEFKEIVKARCAKAQTIVLEFLEMCGAETSNL